VVTYPALRNCAKCHHVWSIISGRCECLCCIKVKLPINFNRRIPLEPPSAFALSSWIMVQKQTSVNILGVSIAGPMTVRELDRPARTCEWQNVNLKIAHNKTDRHQKPEGLPQMVPRREDFFQTKAQVALYDLMLHDSAHRLCRRASVIVRKMGRHSALLPQCRP
jgi:hypothetical protein